MNWSQEISTICHAFRSGVTDILGNKLDGYYLLLEDARQKSPPQSQMWQGAIDNSWALHREHILAGRCLILHGPESKVVYPKTSWPEIESALLGELAYVEEHLHDYPAYCILNLCRLMYSFVARDVVVSKWVAGSWARKEYPQWSRLIDLAKKAYAGRVDSTDETFMTAEVGHLFRFANERIQECLEVGRIADN